VDLEHSLFDPEPEVVKTERNWAAESGIRFEHIPLHPIRAPSTIDLQRALSLIADPSNQPVYVHCHRGSDRTGIVVAAYRIRYDGWTIQDTFEEMKRYGHRNILLFWWKNRLKAFVNE
jgi:tyrosine-protein phosphatase SIW14